MEECLHTYLHQVVLVGDFHKLQPLFSLNGFHRPLAYFHDDFARKEFPLINQEHSPKHRSWHLTDQKSPICLWRRFPTIKILMDIFSWANCGLKHFWKVLNPHRWISLKKDWSEMKGQGTEKINANIVSHDGHTDRKKQPAPIGFPRAAGEEEGDM